MHHTNGFRIPAPPASMASVSKVPETIQFVGKMTDASGDTFAVYRGPVVGI